MRQAVVIASAFAIVLVAPGAAARWLPAPILPDPTRVGDEWSWTTFEGDLDGAEIVGALTLAGTAGAEEGYVVENVMLWIDGFPAGEARGTEAWTFSLDTTQLADGAHDVRAYAMARLAAVDPSPITHGYGSGITITTLNHLPGTILYEHEYDATGVTPEMWSLVLREGYAGLRIRVETAAADEKLPAPTGQLVVGYVDGGEDGPERAWVVERGATGGSTMVSRPPHSELDKGGVLTMDGAFAGDGRVRIVVEALPAAD